MLCASSRPLQSLQPSRPRCLRRKQPCSSLALPIAAYVSACLIVWDPMATCLSPGHCIVFLHALCRPLLHHNSASALHHPLFPCLPLQVHPPTSRQPPSRLLVPTMPYLRQSRRRR